MDGTTVRDIVLRSPRARPFSFDGWSFAEGFFCASLCDVFLFSVFIVSTDSGGWFYDMATGPQDIWLANRAGLTLLGRTPPLSLRGMATSSSVYRWDHGKMVWSSATSDKSMIGMEITKLSNLVLFDQKNSTVRQSFHHRLIHWPPCNHFRKTQSQLYYITALPDGLYYYVESTPPQLYFSYAPVQNYKTRNDPIKVTFKNGSLSIIMQSSEPRDIMLPPALSSQHMRLESDGHLRLHQWSGNIKQWTFAYKPLCGDYGICANGQCTCLFRTTRTVVNLNRNDCKQACQHNCSCREVVFRYGQDDSNGECFWVTKVFSLQSIQPEALHYNSTAYIKVHILVLLLVIVAILYLQRRKYEENDEDSDFDQLSVMPARFPLEKKKFLAKVETIGSIEHINLVNLTGFCAEKSQRLLIYNRHNNAPLDWSTQRRIILDIAKLQNILLDENFNAEVADFGLPKLIHMYQRKSIDRSQPKENLQLINLLREKAQHNQWIDLIDTKSDDMVSHEEDVIQIMKLAIWCLQNNSIHRPSMATVIKILEGTVSVEVCIVQSFLNANKMMSVQDNPCPYSVPSQASILSGPR
ncbi:hypothetical protein BRADI_4g12808v3 [Brachypodium distachyon]|uniref:non-specific serine/threonine protein kinase n=1 Tax=Brachypodium distachyon TaxID=15368 RepID=A0A0Q3EMY5_BRADI|nr:hypothetical protein BRADI_4g12808v3 [Brachypodium distachyon]